MVLHASITNLIVYHSFLQQCPVWRSMNGQYVEPDEAALRPEDLDSGDDEEHGVMYTHDWGFNFGPMNDVDLRAGHMIKERLKRMLDHPDLENHLLRRANLMPLLVSYSLFLYGNANTDLRAGAVHTHLAREGSLPRMSTV